MTSDGHPMINLPNLMSKAIVLGNGESRGWINELPITANAVNWNNDIPLWGCNAVYRDFFVDNLVSVDYAMQQEIYQEDMDDCMQLWFANWSPVPAEIAEMMFMGYDIPESYVHKTKRNGHHTEQCVISGKDPNTIQEQIKTVMESNPTLDEKDLQLKMGKDAGIWITYIKEPCNVKNIDFPIGWAAGNTALHLASQSQPEEVYILGFDMSSYDEPLNNIYKGTDNYLPADAKGFNSVNWIMQMETTIKEFRDIDFYWVDSTERTLELSNLHYMDGGDFRKELHLCQ